MTTLCCGFSVRFSRLLLRCCLAIMLIAAVSFGILAEANAFDGPSFRRGEWRFIRTLDYVLSRNVKQRVSERVMTRCVDPTESMKGTFASNSIGICVSAKPQRSGNTYTFSRRCDYMGPVRTVITVQSQDSYIELNEMAAGKFPQTDTVVAKRIGDCHDAALVTTGSSTP